MPIRTRFTGMATTLAAAAFALAGCIQLDGHLTITADDTVNGQITVSLDKALLPANSQQQTFATYLENMHLPPGRKSEYTTADRYGTTIHYDQVPVSEFNSGGSLTISRQDGNVRLRVDVASWTTYLASVLGNPDAAKDDGGIELSVRFPGTVLSTTPQGTVTGTTVTWRVPDGQLKPAELVAVAELPRPAPPSAVQTSPGAAATPPPPNSASETALPEAGSSSFPWLPIIGVVVVALLLIIVFMLLRRTPASATPDDEAGATP